MASEERWALITGVSQGGLGDALAQQLLKNNVNVIASGLDTATISHIKPTTTTRLEKVHLDVTSIASITSAVAGVTRITNGKLSILVNNAGYGYTMPLLDADVASIKRNFDVNVFGMLYVTQAFFPLLQEGKGMVVNQASIAGLPGCYQPFIGSYTANKAAVVSLSNTLRLELAPFDVKVVTLITGDVKTHFWDNVQGGHAGLPVSSLYQPLKAKVEAMMKGETNPPGQHSAERWAKNVVNDLLKPSPPSRITRGYLAVTMSIVSWLFPIWLLDTIYSSVAELSKLRTIPQAQTIKKNV